MPNYETKPRERLNIDYFKRPPPPVLHPLMVERQTWPDDPSNREFYETDDADEPTEIIHVEQAPAASPDPQ